MTETAIDMEEKGNEEIDRQLAEAKRKSSQKLAENMESTKSAYVIQEGGNPDAFCSETVSWYNPWLRNFETSLCFLVVLCLFFNSYMFFFVADMLMYNTAVAADVFYIFHMFLRSRTGHMIDGVEERNLYKIRERYQASIAFYLDLLSMIPLSQMSVFLPGSPQLYYALGRQKQYVRLQFVLYYLGIREEEPGSSTFIYRSLKYVLLSLLTIHFLACGWYGLACSRYDEAGFDLTLCGGRSWIMHLPRHIIEKVLEVTTSENAAMSEVSFLHNTYVTSLYWSTATATSTGYGDVHAWTIEEKVYSIFAMIIGMLVLYGMTMGGMTSMLTNMDARRSSFVQRYKAFENEVEQMGITDNVKDLCLRSFDYFWHRWNGENVQGSGFLKVLPEALRASFAEATFHRLVRKADLLKETEDAFCRNLALVSQPMVYLENQFVQRSGEIASNMCYIQHGIVEVLDADEEEVVAMMHSGKLFGQILLVFDLPRINSIRCKTNCDIFVLNKHDFRMVLSDYPEAAKQFCDAARDKCEGPDKQWPMEPPDFSDFNNFIEKTSAAKRRHTVITGTKQTGSELPDVSMARRMTTVYSTNYEGVDLSRVPMHKTKERMALEEVLTSDAPRPSLVDFVLNGEPQKLGKRSLTKIKDGTEMIAANANYEDLAEAVGPEAKYKDPDVTTIKERLFNLTIINPKGYFYAFWINYIFCISLFTGLYTTLLAFFSTTPGMETFYNGTEAESVDLLSIAGYMCDNSTSAYMSTCGSMTGFSAIADCIRGVGGTFGSMITAHDGGYGVVVPATYDISLVAYNPESDEGRLHIFITYFIIDLSFYINIFVNLRTEVLTPNGFLTSFKDILANYNKWDKLWIDIIALVPIEILSASFTCSRISKYHMMAFLRLNRLIYFFRYVPTSFTRWEYSLDVKIVRIRTLKLLVYIYTFTHMCSCYYYFWSCGYAMQSDLERIEYKCRFGSWAWVFDITYATNRGQDYIKTMYWASTTMTSTGYGDISASTTTGRLFALITMIIGTFMYGWLVAMIASTVSNTEAAEVSFRNSMLAMKQYLVVHSVPPPLVDRVLSVRRIEWERYRGTVTPGIETIGRELPEQLHSVMMYESVNKFVEGLPFFHGVDSSFIAMLCNHVMIYHYSEGDVIIYEGDLSRNLYIIKQGHCDVITEDLEEVIDSLRPGDYFGETEVLFSCSSPRTVVAETACEVLVLTRGDIDEVLQSFPILESQMETIENDQQYKDRVLHAIKRRNAGGQKGELMGDRYNLAEIEGGTILFAEPCEKPFLVHKLKGSNAELQPATSEAGKIFSKLLMPMTFDPKSQPFVFYESLRIVLIFLMMIIVPIQYAYLPRHPALMTLQYVLDGLSLVDQYIRAHVSYYDDRAVIVTHPVRTAHHYLKTSFALDLMSWFPIELIAYAALGSPMSEQQWRLVAILRITRYLQFYKVFAYFSYWFSDIRYSRRWLKHISSALFAVIIHHTFACLLFLSACPPENVNNGALYRNMSDMVVLNASGSDTFCHKDTWIGKIAQQNLFPSLDLIRSVADQYIVSLYWATATLVCVGYGDIHASKQAEMFMAIVVMICGTVYYSSILGDISANIQTDDIRRGHYKGRLSDILKFFKVYDVSKDTQRQVLDYYCYLWDRTRGVTPDYLLVGLPPSLRTSVCQSMYDPMIREAFDEGGPDVDKETQGFFRLMSTHIQPHLYLKQSIVCRRDDIGDEMFFIQRGDVAILEDDDETVSRVLGPGQHFGEVALMFATPRSRTIKALTNCDLNVLSKSDLDDILSKFPRFRERMTRIAQDRKMHGTRSMTFDKEPSDDALARGSLFNVQGYRRDGTDLQKFTKIMDRESKFSSYWKQLTILLVFFSASVSVYQACFFNHSSQLYIIGYIVDVWFALDMIMSFHTSFLDEFSTNVDDRLKIHLAYGKSLDRFALDAFANAPIDVFAHFISADPALKLTIMSILRLNRVLRMYRLMCIFKELESDIRHDALVFRVYKFILFVVFGINTMGGIFYVISCPMSQCGSFAWTSQSVTNYGVHGIYGHTLLPWVDSLYWAVATMTSTGYGDITPQTQGEMLFSCFVMILGKLMLGYVLGMVAATLANDESLRVWYEQSVTSVKNYMTDLKFDKELFEHVVHYYDYMWMKNQGVNVMELFPDLSFSLRADIYTQICRKMVDGIELFEGCPENFLRHLCMAMVPIAYMPGDYICLQGDIRNEMYVINHGVAEAIQRIEGKKVPIRLVMEGEHFLCESVLAKVRRPCSLRARTYVDVFSMTMEALQNVLNYHPKAKPIVLENARRLYPDLNL